jgi:hypothetical protein
MENINKDENINPALTIETKIKNAFNSVPYLFLFRKM